MLRCCWMIIKEICLHSVTKIFARIEVNRFLHTFNPLAQNYIIYAECHSFKLLMADELGSEVSINLLDSVLGCYGGACSVV